MQMENNVREKTTPPDPKSNVTNYFFVKTETRMERIESPEVLYVEGMGDYWRIVQKPGAS